MPTTMTADEPRRWLSVLMPTDVTERACAPLRNRNSHSASSTTSARAPCQGSITHAASTASVSRTRPRFFRNFMVRPSLQARR
jgi:hypothetical protein